MRTTNKNLFSPKTWARIYLKGYYEARDKSAASMDSTLAVMICQSLYEAWAQSPYDCAREIGCTEQMFSLMESDCPKIEIVANSIFFLNKAFNSIAVELNKVGYKGASVNLMRTYLINVLHRDEFNGTQQTAIYGFIHTTEFCN